MSNFFSDPIDDIGTDQQTTLRDRLRERLTAAPQAEQPAAPVCDEVVDDGFARRQLPADQSLEFMMAGNATVTLVSKKTGTRFTFRIKASDDRAVHFVSLLNGNDNERSFAYFGYIKRGVFYHGGAKAKVGKDAPSAKAFAWAFQRLTAGTDLSQMEIWHEGRCGRCARKLTVPASIASGYGPECIGRM